MTILGPVSDQPVSVSADELHAVGARPRSGKRPRAEHVADVMLSGELARLRETIEVLSDTEAVRALADTEPVVHGRDAVRALITERAAREHG